MRLHFFMVSFGLLVPLASGGCGGWQFGFANQDRPGAENGLPPPIAFEPCSRKSNQYERSDVNHDGRVDTIRVMDNGAEVCRGTDTDDDGKIDTWDVLENGNVARRARDSDGNGQVDQSWTWKKGASTDCATIAGDADGDGNADGPSQYTCGVRNSIAVARPAGPLAPLAAPTRPLAPPTRPLAPLAAPAPPAALK